MLSCFAIDDIKTPQGFLLRGLWFGPKKPKRVIIWVHGLGSSVFTKLSLMEHLVDKETAVLAFNNRGFERVATVKRKVGKITGWLELGAAHETFTDCVDDIQGAINFVRKQKVGDIYLAGHSTGCQKSVYWAHKKGGRGVKGIILLAPVSDYAGVLKRHGKAKLEKAAKYARALVRRKEPHTLLSKSIWSGELNDAQRFLSLYTPDSVEEIFSYAVPTKKPAILQSIKKPVLVLWPEEDEYADRPAAEATKWFEATLRSKHTIRIIPGVKHSFRGGEQAVARAIKEFMRG